MSGHAAAYAAELLATPTEWPSMVRDVLTDAARGVTVDLRTIERAARATFSTTSALADFWDFGQVAAAEFWGDD